MSIRGIRRVAIDHVLRPVWEGLMALGMLYLAGEVLRAEDERSARPLTGPAGNHPERLRPDLPLTRQERKLARHLERRGIPLE
ncbi:MULTISPECIES: DUF6059 family protein [unclassified Streptomyces]|uniref:DUF6059 family protein n=1 Tax=unclassified Streptomyces TaxID=2593676 RepID=UPI003316D3B5